MYFKYGIKNSVLETAASEVPPPPTPQPNVLDRTTLPPPAPPAARPGHDRNIFEGDGGANMGLYGNDRRVSFYIVIALLGAVDSKYIPSFLLQSRT